MVESVGRRLKKLRKDNYYTQNQIAEYLGLKQWQVSGLENDNMKLNNCMILKLSYLYGCSLVYISCGIGENPNPEDRFNDPKFSLNDIAEMNRIIYNLEFLSRISS